MTTKAIFDPYCMQKYHGGKKSANPTLFADEGFIQNQKKSCCFENHNISLVPDIKC